jgi:hypothetical protein
MLAVCFVAGYLVAGWWSGEDDTTPLQEICARVDYVNLMLSVMRPNLPSRSLGETTILPEVHPRSER